MHVKYIYDNLDYYSYIQYLYNAFIIVRKTIHNNN